MSLIDVTLLTQFVCVPNRFYAAHSVSLSLIDVTDAAHSVSLSLIDDKPGRLTFVHGCDELTVLPLSHRC